MTAVASQIGIVKLQRGNRKWLYGRGWGVGELLLVIVKVNLSVFASGRILEGHTHIRTDTSAISHILYILLLFVVVISWQIASSTSRQRTIHNEFVERESKISYKCKLHTWWKFGKFVIDCKPRKGTCLSIGGITAFSCLFYEIIQICMSLIHRLKYSESSRFHKRRNLNDTYASPA